MRSDELKTTCLLDISHSIAGDALSKCEYPWEILPEIKDLALSLGASLPAGEYVCPSPDIWIHNTATVAPTASITGPCIIGPGTEVRQCAFIRGSAIIGANCVIGNSTEVKNAIIFDNVQVPHFNYVGDSVLGYKSHFGAGAVTSNVKSDRTLVKVKCDDLTIETGRKKFGAMVGDHVEVGCNTVLNPGTVIGRNTNIYPLSCVRGAIPSDSIYKSESKIVIKRSDI